MIYDKHDPEYSMKKTIFSIKVNGSTVKAADAISLIEGKIVSYNLDSNGKISKIDLIEVFNNDTAKKKYRNSRAETEHAHN